MKLGTKSLLFGAHQFLVHPFFVFRAWWILYGFPWHPALWFAFLVHDWGYWGKPNMDGPEGKCHPELGARIMHWLCDWPKSSTKWYEFALFHSRHYAKHNGAIHSRLCVADKLAAAITPCILYLPLVKLTGEIDEYMQNGKRANGVGLIEKYHLRSDNPYKWWLGVTSYLARWAFAHKDCTEDTWTYEYQQDSAC